MFNSRKINNDPMPWQSYFDGQKTCRSAEKLQDIDIRLTGAQIRCVWRPRPEFDNNPNPILVEFRDANVSGRRALEVLERLEVVYGVDKWPTVEPTYEQYWHARKVLTRLVNIFGTEESR